MLKQTTHIMTRIQMTDDQILTDLKNTFGKEFKIGRAHV
jgi:hypothetical protein